MGDLLARLADHWKVHGAAPGAGTPGTAIADFETQHKIRLPSDLRAYFATLNGLALGRDDMTDETIGFWRLADLTSIAEEEPRANVPDAQRCFVIADYLIGSHFYAAPLSSNPEAKAPVLIAVDRRMEYQQNISVSGFGARCTPSPLDSNDRLASSRAELTCKHR